MPAFFRVEGRRRAAYRCLDVAVEPGEGGAEVVQQLSGGAPAGDEVDVEAERLACGRTCVWLILGLLVVPRGRVIAGCALALRGRSGGGQRECKRGRVEWGGCHERDQRVSPQVSGGGRVGVREQDQRFCARCAGLEAGAVEGPL